MTNILPTLSATGTAPKIITKIDNYRIYVRVGSVRKTEPKPRGGLDFQNNEYGSSWWINKNLDGYNGVRFSEGFGGGMDVSNAIMFVHFSANAWNRIQISTKDDDGFVVHLITDTGFSDVRHYRIGGFDTKVGKEVGRHIISIDPTYTGHSDTGNFDPTVVKQMAFTNDTTGANDFAWFFASSLVRVYKTKEGATGFYGNNPSFKNYADEALTVGWGLVELSPKTYQLIAPFKIGDAIHSNSIDFTDDGSTIIAPRSNKDDGDYRLQWNDNSIPFYLDLQVNDKVNLNGTVFDWGVKSYFDFNSSVGAEVNLTNVVFKGMGEIEFGSDVSGSVTISSEKTTINGADLTGTINNDVYLTTETDLHDLVINGDLHIDTGIDSDLIFTNVKVVGKVFNDSNKKLNISLKNSDVTTDEAGTGNGEVNLLNPMYITFKNLPADNALYVIKEDGTKYLYDDTQTGDYTITIPKSYENETWKAVINKAGYQPQVASFTISAGIAVNINTNLIKIKTPDGSDMFQNQTSNLVTVEFNGSTQANIDIGDGIAPLQATYDETERALQTEAGMFWLASGKGACSMFNSASGDYLFMPSGWRLRRRDAGDANATLQAFAQSQDGIVVDDINGSVAFLTSDSPQQIAEAVWKALKAVDYGEGTMGETLKDIEDYSIIKL